MKHKDFGAALKTGRIAKGLSTRDVSSLTGISYSLISRCERDGSDPSCLYMLLMFDLYGIDLSDMANTLRLTSYHRDRHAKSTPHKHIKREATLGAMLRAGRESKRLSTRAVNAITGITYANVSRYETSGTMPSFTATVKMCDLYGIDLNDMANLLRNRSP